MKTLTISVPKTKEEMQKALDDINLCIEKNINETENLTIKSLNNALFQAFKRACEKGLLS